jgi:hypothetical protein
MKIYFALFNLVLVKLTPLEGVHNAYLIMPSRIKGTPSPTPYHHDLDDLFFFLQTWRIFANIAKISSECDPIRAYRFVYIHLYLLVDDTK